MNLADFDTTGMTKEQLRDAVTLLDTVESTSGRTAKETLLLSGSDNPVFTLFIKLTFGQHVFNITVDPEWVQEVNPELIIPAPTSFTNFVSLASSLIDRTFTGTAAQDRVLLELRACHPKLRKWLVRIINRDLRVGIGKKTIEKLFDGLLVDTNQDGAPRYRGCMAAKKLTDVYASMSELTYPLAAELKLDGERSNNFVCPNVSKVFVLTRGGKRKVEIEAVALYTEQIQAFSQMLRDAAGLPADTALFLDGEFLAKDWNATASVVNRSKNFDPQKFIENVRVVLWDWAPLSAYEAGRFDMPWLERKHHLQAAAGAPIDHPSWYKASSLVYVIGHRIAKNEAELQQLYNSSLDNKFEGLMLKQLSAPHVFTRKHNFMLKLKPFDSTTGVIVALVSGEGKHAAATPEAHKRAIAALSQYGNIVKDGTFYHVAINSDDQTQKILDKLRSAIYDDVDRRLSTHLPGFVSYRYSERLGYFVVACNGKEFHVGGGISHQDRLDFWQRRRELIGTKLDFRSQRTDTADAVARFNSFERLREGLVIP